MHPDELKPRRGTEPRDEDVVEVDDARRDGRAALALGEGEDGKQGGDGGALPVETAAMPPPRERRRTYLTELF